MTTYHTGNPVGSTNPKDLYDNAQNLDDLMLGPLRQYLDRLGVPRLSWAGIEAAFLEDQASRAEQFSADQVQRSLDFDEAQTNRENVFNQFLIGTQFEMPPIPYQEGGPIEVSRPTQLISHEGQLYSVKLPASFPFQLSGIWDVAVVSLTPREDASVRQQLARPNGVDMVGGARKVIRLGDYCTGDFDWGTLKGTSNTMAWRKAVSDCPEGGVIVGEPGQTYYLDMQPDGSVVDIFKGLQIDLQTAGVAYKPYLSSDPAGTFAPAIFFSDVAATRIVGASVSPCPFGASIIQVDDAGGIADGDMLMVSSMDLMNPWNYPDSSQEAIHAGCDIVKVRKVAGNFVALFSGLQHDYATAPRVTKINMLQGVKVCNFGPTTGEVDPRVLKTFPAGPRAGHLVSIVGANHPIAEKFDVSHGHRMHAVSMSECYTPFASKVRSVATTTQYRAQAGHQYTLHFVRCASPTPVECEGFGVRHVFDYTDCTGARSKWNKGYSCYGAFNTHGHREYDVESEDDHCYNDESADNSGWTVGNFSFRNTDNVKIIRPFYRGGGVPITVGFMSTDCMVEQPDCITSHPQAVIVASGAGRVKVRGGGVLRSTSENPNPTVLCGANYSINTGATTFTSDGGVNPVVTMTGTVEHGLTPGQSVWLSLPEPSEGQYARFYVVLSATSPTQCTLGPRDAFTASASLNFSAAWSSMNGRVTLAGNFKPIGDVEIDTNVIKDRPSQLGLISYSGNGRLTLGGFVAPADGSRYAARIHALLSSASTSFDFRRLRLIGAHWGPLQIEHAKIDRRCIFREVDSPSHSQYAIQAVGRSLQDLQALGLNFFDNILETVGALGVLNFQPFQSMAANPGRLKIRGNSYGSQYASSLGFDYERGVWVPVAGATSVTAPPNYSNQIGRYAFDGNVMVLSFRVDWTGFVGSGDAFISGLPFPVPVAFNQPAASAEFFATGIAAGDVPALSLTTAGRFILRRQNGGTLSFFSAPSTASMVVTCSIPL